MNEGILYIVATPIGNLGDITFRAVELLKQVDLIAVEDSRHSKKLLAHYQISRPIFVYHEHNENQQREKLLHKLQEGRRIALISDAGTPLISDPGYSLVKSAREQGIQVIPIPGASAVITALCVSGMPTDRFIFEGFLPVKLHGLKSYLETIKYEERTLIFYEAPHRLLTTVRWMREFLGDDRRLCIAKELTKLHEAVYLDTLGNLATWFVDHQSLIKGEFVLLLEGSKTVKPPTEGILQVLLEELPIKQAVKLAVKLKQGSRNELYRQACVWHGIEEGELIGD